MDELLLALRNVSEQLLPIAGAAALIFLCILLKKAGALVDSITATVKNLDPTIKNVNSSMEKVQAPLDTVVKLSRTVDQVQDKTSEAIGKAAEFAAENVEGLKTMVQEKMGAEDAPESEAAQDE